MEDGDAIANVLDVCQQMAAHHDGLSTGAEIEDEILHFAGADRVEAGGWLIQKNDLGIVDEGLGESDSASHPLGILFDQTLAGVVQADLFDEGAGTLLSFRPADVEEPAVEIEGLLGGEELVEVRLFG